jgi:hypothetical protein
MNKDKCVWGIPDSYGKGALKIYSEKRPTINIAKLVIESTTDKDSHLGVEITMSHTEYRRLEDHIILQVGKDKRQDEEDFADRMEMNE